MIEDSGVYSCKAKFKRGLELASSQSAGVKETTFLVMSIKDSNQPSERIYVTPSKSNIDCSCSVLVYFVFLMY